ncbi:hypothetical protein D3C75_1285770 [compost metagenome]
MVQIWSSVQIKAALVSSGKSRMQEVGMSKSSIVPVANSLVLRMVLQPMVLLLSNGMTEAGLVSSGSSSALVEDITN